MSVLRVITRIIPLNGDETSFEPAPIETLTEGIHTETEVFNVTDARTGMIYQIERIKEIQIADSGETAETINQAFAEKLEKIPGFVQLNENDTQLNPYDKSLQLSLPQVVSVKDGNILNETSNSMKVSLVKNVCFNQLVSNNNSSESSINGDEQFQTKYRCSVKKYKQKYKWRNRKRIVHKSRKYVNYAESDSSVEQTYETTNCNHQTSDEEVDFNEVNEKLSASECAKVVNNLISNNAENKNDTEKIEIADKETSDISKQNLLYHSDVEDVVKAKQKNVFNIQMADVSENNNDKSSSSSTDVDQSSLKIDVNSIISDINKSVDNQSEPQQISDSNTVEYMSYDNVCTKYFVPPEDPLYDFIESLKSYFMNSECLICGFIFLDADYNAAMHMKSHISSNASYTCYKCSYCKEKFFSPRSLFMHALSHVKSCDYRCDICSLKFKRRHYLLCHNAKAH